MCIRLFQGVYTMKTITYKREEISDRLALLIYFKNTMGYSVEELTEALGYKGNTIYKVLKRELPATDEIYNRTMALLNLNKIQEIRGREQEFRERVRIALDVQKITGVEGLAKLLGVTKDYMENVNAGKNLIGDKLFNELLSVLDTIKLQQELEREEKRRAKIFKISDVIEGLAEDINRLELSADIEENEDYYSEINSKKRAIKRLRDMEASGVKEVTPNGGGYTIVG